MWKLFGLFFNKSNFPIPGLQIGLFRYNTDTNTLHFEDPGLGQDMINQCFAKTIVSVRRCNCKTFEIAMIGIIFLKCRTTDGCVVELQDIIYDPSLKIVFYPLITAVGWMFRAIFRS